MPIRFTPTNEQETKKFSNLPPGTYPFTVLESSEVPCKSGKHQGDLQAKIKLNVHGKDFKKHVYDYLAPWVDWKMKHFMETIGLGQVWLSGVFDARDNVWKDRTGYVELDIETDPIYGDRNKVVDYMPNYAQRVEVKPDAKISPEDVPAKPATQQPKPADDDVPF